MGHCVPFVTVCVFNSSVVITSFTPGLLRSDLGTLSLWGGVLFERLRWYRVMC